MQVNKLLTDNRAASILRLLGTRSGMSVAELAGKLSVSERTIRNDIKQLNSDLKDSAVSVRRKQPQIAKEK